MKNVGNPSKLTNNLIDAIKKVLDEYDLIAMTDEDIYNFTNNYLPENEKFSYTTFKNYKAGKLPEKNVDKEIIKEYLSVIKKAFYIERKNLLKKLEKDSQWQKYAWILERKFNEWNLKHISESDVKINSGLNITVNNQDQADSINNMLDAIE